MLKSRLSTPIGSALFVMLSFAINPGVFAQPNSDTVVGLKTALIYRTSTFVTWPENTFEKKNEPLIIGVLENERIQKKLAKDTKELSIAGHPIKVIRVSLDDDWSSLHILFVDSSATEAFLRMDKNDYAESPILTLGDSTTFAEGGGIIQIFMENNKPRIKVNIDAARRKKLSISVRLLEIVDIVRDK